MSQSRRGASGDERDAGEQAEGINSASTGTGSGSRQEGIFFLVNRRSKTGIEGVEYGAK